MRLDQALVKKNLCESREEAQEMIVLGNVLVDGQVVYKQAKHIEELSVIEVTRRRKFVSRGGDKLEGALNDVYHGEGAIKSFLTGKNAIDIGSSTGGFTDCLLSYGITDVTAIDVGTLQMHSRLRGDQRVMLLENKDIRDYETSDTFSIVVADLSFIPLLQVIDKVISLGSTPSYFFLLIKPQFEVGKGNTKKGIVKNAVLVSEIIETYKNLAIEKGLSSVTCFPSKVVGSDGNQEYFLFGVKD